MIQELRSMFEKQAGVEKFDLIQSFHACKQEEGKSVADYVLKMKGYVEQLERLGYMLPQDISVGLILNGLTKDFVGFVRNYNMHNMGKTIGEIHAMLIEYEKGLPKKAETPTIKMIKRERIRRVYIPKPNNPKPAAKERLAKDDACHHCKEVGHWKRNCPVYLAELQKKRKQVGSASSSGIFTIELFSFPNNNSWVYDTGCGTNICITKQGFRIERKLKQGALYFNSGIRVKHNLDSTYLWNCRLAHINKKRIKQLQQDGLLKSTDDDLFDKCESCLSGKMTKKPFPHSNERAKDLLLE
ncbi:retrotransposon protein, putative, ty1-copia subclass [Tanacetum coccineum]